MDQKMTDCYIAEKYLKNVYKDEARQLKMVTGDSTEFQKWQTAARRQLGQLLSVHRFQEVPLNPRMVESFATGEYVREKIIIQTENDVELPMFFLFPNGQKKTKIPIVLIFPRDDRGKSETVRVAGYQEADGFDSEKGADCLALRLVRLGYAVAAPDTIGSGERKVFWESEKKQTGDLCRLFQEQLNKVAVTLGYSLTGMNVWDGIRIIDYLQMRKEFDGRLFCGGAQDGGMLSLFLAALDKRIQGVFVRGCFYGFHDLLFERQEESVCKYVPDICRYFDISDIGAMIAPRPLFIDDGAQNQYEWKRGPFNILAQILQTADAYQCLDAKEKLLHSVHQEINPDRKREDKIINFIERFSLQMKA